MGKLDIQHKHILKLIARDRDSEGWAKVSDQLYPVLSKNIPTELAEFEKQKEGSRARLTDEGESVLNAMKWL